MQQPQLSQNLVTITDYLCLPLSAAGSIYMIYGYISNPRKSFPAKLIVSLAISNLILSLVNFLDLVTKDTILCNFQGFMRSVGIYSQMLWATEILAILYFQFIWRVPKLDNYFKPILLTNVLLSSLPSIITAVSQINDGRLYFGSTDGSCNILPLDDYVYLMVIPFSVLVLLGCFMTLKVYLVLRSLDVNFVNLEYKNLFAFPATLLLLIIPASIDFSLGGFVQNGFYEILTAIVLCIFKSIGLINAFIYRRTFFSGGSVSESVQDLQPTVKVSEIMLNSSYDV